MQTDENNVGNPRAAGTDGAALAGGFTPREDEDDGPMPSGRAECVVMVLFTAFLCAVGSLVGWLLSLCSQGAWWYCPVGTLVGWATLYAIYRYFDRKEGAPNE